jgi:monoamine oxidase
MTNTIIIGAGLSGLALASALHLAGEDVMVVDARNRVGGRILSLPHMGSAVDIGPAWFWPGQPRIAALVDQLDLYRFDQFATGALIFEDHTGSVQRGRGYASMEGSWRLRGGLGALTDALASTLPEASIRLNTRVTGLEQSDDGVKVLTNGVALHARRVVLALPPRLAATLRYEPALTATQIKTLAQVPTWMAGQAKAVAIYPTAFWREDGLSGDAMSRFGPMVEIHDASPSDTSFGALFGFIGVPPSVREDKAALRSQVQAQFTRLFGAQAAHPTALHITDWAREPFTATDADTAPLAAHPTYGLPTGVQTLMEGRVILSGTETAREFGGFLEGALEAAEDAWRFLRG